jgi:hypothetical protein
LEWWLDRLIPRLNRPYEKFLQRPHIGSTENFHTFGQRALIGSSALGLVVPKNTFSALMDLILYFHGIFG